MDDIVKQAMAKWPNVPDCFGWLGLDARGQWFLRDDAVQALGTFDESKGSLLVHEKLLAFIARNYARDDLGRWFFQNGPQRVYVELEAAPFVWRLQPGGQVQAQTGALATPQACLVDEQGRVYLATELGLGLVHSQDVGLVADGLEQQRWPQEDVLAGSLPARFHFVRSPAQQQTPA
ncbi:DUF2946 family protein [Pantoea sp. 18069]|uniref:DUF2946 family protein n=1 Tax=Pantoea sp. 18069 TaxID=2681415 RepID=UPI0013584CE3|nr:DUF2946 family protein [Pantoea sp. 18069]